MAETEDRVNKKLEEVDRKLEELKTREVIYKTVQEKHLKTITIIFTIGIISITVIVLLIGIPLLRTGSDINDAISRLDYKVVNQLDRANIKLSKLLNEFKLDILWNGKIVTDSKIILKKDKKGGYPLTNLLFKNTGKKTLYITGSSFEPPGRFNIDSVVHPHQSSTLYPNDIYNFDEFEFYLNENKGHSNEGELTVDYELGTISYERRSVSVKIILEK